MSFRLLSPSCFVMKASELVSYQPRVLLTNCFHAQNLRPHYNLEMQSISVNGQTLPIDSSVFATSGNQGTIVDSGTTLAYLAKDTYDPVINAVNSFNPTQFTYTFSFFREMLLENYNFLIVNYFWRMGITYFVKDN